ncbi:endonuclease/exonuclease/phosphatase family protein [Allokutzneria sp. A3M-2-11 16]|uniref:endonuclease/exonuclease/phosphatase family protein n=1 Tax=Allokutzneria sp. A3M-2-11 16 TaxID=2962043 RepID=UPI0020B80B1C|nr:endonuclease/exonuclease/phosphatase family protein [Allokutzneria sp. A3M-2-11 16]MCP3799718.1 endonuclease/exonuclease/phosphatase family protein [Allokutzneria sp. A3M-2-11 16]
MVVLAAPTAYAEHKLTTRFATFNASLNRATEGELLANLSTKDDPQARKVAEVVQRVRPDVLLLNEFDYVSGNRAVDAFRRNYLEVGQQGAKPIEYRYAFTAPVNTGVPTGVDLNNDGKIGGGDDAYGFGLFPGQYGMVVLSKHPIDTAAIRTFQKFRWADMPNPLLPKDFYSKQAQEILRLSSKSHWDLPIQVGRRQVHFLVSHPTPPTFDGPEDRNGKRNHDEIRFWADYVNPGKDGYIYDDAGKRGGLAKGPFVFAGDQNADPVDGDSANLAAKLLLNAHKVIDPMPHSIGAVEAALVQGGANKDQRGPSWQDTGDFNDKSPGNLRIDYVLPSLPLIPVRAGVFWEPSHSPLARLNDTSDHHAVWVDVIG